MLRSGRLLPGRPYLQTIDLPGTNGLAFYEKALLMAVKKFYNIGPCSASRRIEESSSSVQEVLETRMPGLVGFIKTVPSEMI